MSEENPAAKQTDAPALKLFRGLFVEKSTGGQGDVVYVTGVFAEGMDYWGYETRLLDVDDSPTLPPGARLYTLGNCDSVTFDLTEVLVGERYADFGDVDDTLVSRVDVDWGDGSAPEVYRVGLQTNWNRPRHRFSTEKRHIYEEDELRTDVDIATWHLHPCVTMKFSNGRGQVSTLKLYYKVVYQPFTTFVDEVELLDARLRNDGEVSYKLRFVKYLPEGKRSTIHLVRTGNGDETDTLRFS